MREDTEEEILASRGFNSDVITIRGFTSSGFRDRSRDVLDSVSIWDLKMKILVKDKTLRNRILFDYKDSRVPVLGSDNQVMMLDKASHLYYDCELLYLPLRIVGRIWHSVPESELAILQEESREEGVYWAGEIAPNDSPVRALLEKMSPYLLQACHFFEEDPELNEASAINNDPYSQDVEIFYRPIPNCKRLDCPICLPIQKFLEALNASNKKVKEWFLVGRRFDDKEAIRYDNLKSLQELMRIASTAFKLFNANSSIWDSWSRLDELDN